MYKLIWNGEIIEEEIESKAEAIRLRKEYALAFNDSNIQIKVM